MLQHENKKEVVLDHQLVYLRKDKWTPELLKGGWKISMEVNTMTGLTADESEDERGEMSGDVNESHVGEDKLEE